MHRLPVGSHSAFRAVVAAVAGAVAAEIVAAEAAELEPVGTLSAAVDADLHHSAAALAGPVTELLAEIRIEHRRPSPPEFPHSGDPNEDTDFSIHPSVQFDNKPLFRFKIYPST